MNYAREVDGGTELRVKVIPRASCSEIYGELNGRLKIRLNSPPVDGAANKELIRLLSKCLKIAKGRLEIIRGETGREKTILVRNLDAAAINARISVKLG
ncbi:MAG: DUF167 domain-containing protein [Acidobacteriota bacterium]|nr:DUF167 domain-containing protein [Acidobacteriota bacterium]MDH3528985.1 DUF167 domain-containing protein [Acidobacteriota bacterium]